MAFYVLKSHIHFCHAPLGVPSARHQSPEWTIPSPINCFIQREVIGFQVLLDTFHPHSTKVVSSSSPRVQLLRSSWHLFHLALAQYGQTGRNTMLGLLPRDVVAWLSISHHHSTHGNVPMCHSEPNHSLIYCPNVCTVLLLGLTSLHGISKSTPVRFPIASWFLVVMFTCSLFTYLCQHSVNVVKLKIFCCDRRSHRSCCDQRKISDDRHRLPLSWARHIDPTDSLAPCQVLRRSVQRP